MMQKCKKILLAAVQKERQSVQFYQQLAQQAKNPDLAAIFEVFVKQEEKHVEALKLELFKMGFSIPDEPIPSEVFDSEIVVEFETPPHELTFLDALNLALQRERAAFRLYAELMIRAKDTQIEKMFFELAEQEMRHILQFEREIAAVSGKPHPQS